MNTRCREFLTIATLALLAFPVESRAQTVTSQHTITGGPSSPQSLGPFKKNDVVKLTATLHAADMTVCTAPNTLFPALFVDIVYNNSTHWTVIFRDTLEVPMTRSIVLDQDAGRMQAYVRCVTADLTVELMTPITPKWNQTQIQLGTKAATMFNGAAIVTGGARIGCEFVPVPQWALLCKVSTGLAGMAMVGSAFYVNKIMQDPADPNFTVIAEPVPIVLPAGMDCDGDSTLTTFPECDNLVGNFLQIISLSRAIGTTNDRIQGAKDAGDTFWQSRQEQARQQQQHQLASLYSQNATLLQTFQYAFQNKMADAGATPMTVSAADISTWRNSTAAGWTSDQQNVFAAMGFTPEEMESIRSYHLAQNTSTLAGSYYPETLTSGDFYTTVSQFIGAFGNGTQPIPTPPVTVSVGGLKLSGRRYTLTLFSTATFNATQVTQNTITFGRTGIETTPLSCSNTDDNKDGRVDKVCQFDAAASGFQSTDTLAWVRFVYNGTRFIASTPLSTK